MAATAALVGLNGTGALAATSVVVRTTAGPFEIAAAGDRVAWLEGCGSAGGFAVHRFDVRSGAGTRLTRCRFVEQGAGPVALARTRVMWSVPFTSNHETDGLVTTTARFRHPDVATRFTSFGCGISGCEQGVSGLRMLGTLAGGAGQLVYAIITIAAGTSCSAGFCDQVSTGGKVRRVPAAGGAPVTVPNAPAPALLATGGGLVADVPLVTGVDGVQASHSVDVIGAVSGNPVAGLTIPGEIHAVAISKSLLALLVQAQSGSMRIRSYTPSGTLLGTTALAVRGRLQDDLHAIGRRAVFETARGIFALNADTGRYHRVTVATRPVLGVAVINGPRVVWLQERQNAILAAPIR